MNTDYAGVGVDGNINDCGGAGQLWAVNGDPAVLGNFAAGGTSDPRLWFQTTNSNGSPIFTAPAKGTFVTGPASRNFFHDPGLQNWNLGLYKKFAINERTGFQFRAEAFDAVQSSQPGRRGQESQQSVHVRQSHRQNRGRSESAAIAEILLLTSVRGRAGGLHTGSSAIFRRQMKIPQ